MVFDDLVGVQRLLAAAQNRGVAGLETQARRIRRHVGARFVDDHHHADGRGNLLQFQPVGPSALIQHPADRIRQHRHLAQPLRHAGDAFVIQLEPVQHRGGQPVARAKLHVQRVGLLDGGGVLLQSRGHRQQTGVLLRRRERCQFARRRLGLFGQPRHLFRQIHHGSLF